MQLANLYKKSDTNPFNNWRKKRIVKYTTLYSANRGIWQLPHADFAPTTSKLIFESFLFYLNLIIKSHCQLIFKISVGKNILIWQKNWATKIKSIALLSVLFIFRREARFSCIRHVLRIQRSSSSMKN